MNQPLDAVSTESAPAAIGPYSQAVVAGDLVFTAGQIAIDPATGDVVDGGIAAETAQVLRNLSAVLTAAGSGLDQVIKTTVYLADMGEFAAMNEVYATFFVASLPARAAIEAAALPRGVRVEIDCVASR
ncbi:MAG: Rid family detoxifying hydrolase [Myxococcota bacterium]|jgi:2-iminobutanoate/2-iminopropanoate deaminase|nr:Rid family detoxifying hydrolase [Myxococcota bacterium]